MEIEKDRKKEIGLFIGPELNPKIILSFVREVVPFPRMDKTKQISVDKNKEESRSEINSFDKLERFCRLS